MPWSYDFVFAFFWSDRMIFQPQHPTYENSEDTIKLDLGEGCTISAMLLKHPDARFTVLYNHANAAMDYLLNEVKVPPGDIMIHGKEDGTIPFWDGGEMRATLVATTAVQSELFDHLVIVGKVKMEAVHGGRSEEVAPNLQTHPPERSGIGRMSAQEA